MKQRVLVRRIPTLGFLGLVGLIVLAIVGWGGLATSPTPPTADTTRRPTSGGIISALGPEKPDAPTRSQAFSLIFEYGNCLTNQVDNRLDTIQGTLTLGGSLRSSVMTIPLVLTTAELTTIHQKMVDINFFNYPAQFAIPVGAGTTAAGIYPSATYHWIVNDGTQITEVAWSDSIVSPTTVEAEHLRELAKLTEQIIDAYPQVQQLAPYFLHCA